MSDTVQTAEAAEDAAVEEPAESPERKEYTFSRAVVAGAGTLLVALLAAAGVFGWMALAQNNLDSARDSALATARSYAVTVTSYDYRSMKTNVADVMDGATGEFRDQYSGASAQLQELITKAKATANGEVVHAAVKSATEDSAEVLVFVDQSVTNAGAKKPEVDRSRVLMRLERQDDDRWLVSRLELL